MQVGPDRPPAATPRTLFSPDGFWWWNGAEWKPAVSPDRLWQWNGQTWVPRYRPGAPQGNAGLGVGLTIAVFGGVLVLVTLLTLVVLLTMGNQISNVFSNVVAALTGP